MLTVPDTHTRTVPAGRTWAIETLSRFLAGRGGQWVSGRTLGLTYGDGNAHI